MVGLELVVEFKSEHVKIAADNSDWSTQLVGGERDKVKVVVFRLVNLSFVVGGDNSVGGIALFEIGGYIEDAAAFLSDDFIGEAQPNFARTDTVGATLIETLYQVGAVVK